MPRPPAQNPNKKYVPAAAAIAAAISISTALTVKWEGRRYVAYDDFRPNYALKPGDPIKGTLTVCTGHTNNGGGAPIVIGKRYTDRECDDYLKLDKRVATDAVIQCTPELFENPHTAGAIIDFAYNVGGRAYCNSSIARDFKSGRIESGCWRLYDWVYSKKKFMQGLWNRRDDEQKTCVTNLTK